MRISLGITKMRFKHLALGEAFQWKTEFYIKTRGDSVNLRTGATVPIKDDDEIIHKRDATLNIEGK